MFYLQQDCKHPFLCFVSYSSLEGHWLDRVHHSQIFFYLCYTATHLNRLFFGFFFLQVYYICFGYTLEPWNRLPPRYPHLEALVAGVLTICMFARFRSAAVLLCSDSCRLALPSVFWLYLVIRGADPYGVGRVWKPSFSAFRRYLGLWYSEDMICCHYWNSFQPYGPRSFLALIWTQMQLIVDCMLQRLRRPCVEDLIWLWESTPAMIRMVIMVWGSKPQFSRPQVPMQVVPWNIGTISCNQSTMNTNESQWGGSPWNILAYWNIWHFLLIWCLDLLRETMDMDKDAIQSANLSNKS